MHFYGEAPARAGAIRSCIEPRRSTQYVLDTSCGIGYLGEINGVDWVSKETDVPAAWAGSVDDDNETVSTVKLRGGKDAHVIATASGHGVRYEPVREAPPACDA